MNVSILGIRLYLGSNCGLNKPRFPPCNHNTSGHSADEWPIFFHFILPFSFVSHTCENASNLSLRWGVLDLKTEFRVPHDTQEYEGSGGERERARAAQEVCRPPDGALTRQGPRDPTWGLAGGCCQRKLRRRDEPSSAGRRAKTSGYAAATAPRRRKGGTGQS